MAIRELERKTVVSYMATLPPLKYLIACGICTDIIRIKRKRRLLRPDKEDLLFFARQRQYERLHNATGQTRSVAPAVSVDQTFHFARAIYIVKG